MHSLNHSWVALIGGILDRETTECRNLKGSARCLDLTWVEMAILTPPPILPYECICNPRQVDKPGLNPSSFLYSTISVWKKNENENHRQRIIFLEADKIGSSFFCVKGVFCVKGRICKEARATSKMNFVWGWGVGWLQKRGLGLDPCCKLFSCKVSLNLTGNCSLNSHQKLPHRITSSALLSCAASWKETALAVLSFSFLPTKCHMS